MDFVTGLSRSKDHDTIWVVVDRLTKQRHLVPCSTTVNARDLADIFLQHVFRLHGLPWTITSDRGPQFASAFWHRLCAQLGIELSLSTAFHPQTDGQTERMNAVMEQYLWSYVNYLQDDWAEWLPIAKFVSNNHTLETTAVSPRISRTSLSLILCSHISLRSSLSVCNFIVSTVLTWSTCSVSKFPSGKRTRP